MGHFLADDFDNCGRLLDPEIKMKNKSIWQVVAGGVLLLAGAVMVMGRLGVINFKLNQWWPIIWPVLLVVAGFLILFRRQGIGWILVALALFVVVSGSTIDDQRGRESRGVIRQMEDLAEERRVVENFKKINFLGGGRLIIIEGDEEYLLIEASRKDLENIRTEVVDNTLEIRQTEWWWGSGWNNPNYTLAVKDIDEININGAAEVKSEALLVENLRIVNNGAAKLEANILANEVEVILNGAGQIVLSGKTDNLTVRIAGLGEYQGRDLLTNEARISVSGAGKAEVSTREGLDINISGAGSIDYWGDPRISQNISGLGNVSRKGDLFEADEL